MWFILNSIRKTIEFFIRKCFEFKFRFRFKEMRHLPYIPWHTVWLIVRISQPIEIETWLTLWYALTPTRIFMSPTEIDSKRTNLSFSLFEMRFCNIACPKVTWLNSRLWIDKQTKKISKNWLVTIVKKMESQKVFPRSSIDISVS